MGGKVAKRIFIISFCILLTGLCGCGTNLIRSSYKATDVLVDQAVPPLIPQQPILIASFVNIDNLEESSTFGRTISEYVGSRLAQHNYKVVEMKLRKSVFMKKNAGEFLLSRDLKEISIRHNAQAIVVGTYALAKDIVYISARVISLADSTILSSYSYKLNLDRNTRQMLGVYY
ncbi:FlgO domain-containing protein [Desulfonema magnum]|uniref:FlgO domain-containing protein n=1 Tax=Desulfonema magnum TaxID=45655 RepID=A0A975BPE9_9BACT|nr:FlgO domain-containing protein [Desulfonema magnum]